MPSSASGSIPTQKTFKAFFRSTFSPQPPATKYKRNARGSQHAHSVTCCLGTDPSALPGVALKPAGACAPAGSTSSLAAWLYLPVGILACAERCPRWKQHRSPCRLDSICPL